MEKIEVGEKRPLSHGLMDNPPSQIAKRVNIQSQTDAFLANGGSIEHVEFGTLAGDTKGYTGITINHEKAADGFKTK